MQPNQRRAWKDPEVATATQPRAAATGLVAAAMTGGMLILASPPYNWQPLAVLALVPLWWVIRHTGWRAAFTFGWWAGFIYCGLSTKWWYTALSRIDGLPSAVAFTLTLLIAAWQGLTLGLWAGGTAFFANRNRRHPLLVAPLIIILLESAIFGVMKPYLAIMAWQIWPVVQLAEFGGPAAVSALLVLINGVAAELLLCLLGKRRPGRHELVALAAVAVILSFCIGRGLYVHTARRAAPKIRVGLVHTSEHLSNEQNPVGRAPLIRQALGQATTPLLLRGADLVIWPETHWPGILPHFEPGRPPPPFIQTQLTGFAGKLLFGALTEAADGALYNSAVLVGVGGRAVEAIYSKVKPIPFVEYVPFARKIPQLATTISRLIPNRLFIQPAVAPVLLTADQLRLGTAICNEEIMATHVAAITRLNPNLLVGIASDLWLAGTDAPAQHTAQAALWAVMARRDYVHVTQAGLSVVVDATGRLLTSIQPQAADAKLAIGVAAEAALLETWTPGGYAVPVLPWLCLLALAAGGSAGHRR